jgi:hypothetical protein
MARTVTISCDAPGCEHTTEMAALAGSLEGWLRRDISDSYNKRMAEGMRDFGATVTLHFCPEHAEHAEEVPSPPTHPLVLDFMRQPEDNVPADS